MTSRQLARALRRANARAETKQAKFERAARLAIRDLIRLAATRFEKHVTSFTAAAGDPPGWSPPSTDELLSLDEVISHYRTKTDPVRIAAVNDFFDAFGKEALGSNVKANFHVSNPLIAAELEKTGSQITAVAETTRRNVRGIVSRAYQEGLSISDTAAAIREYAGSISASRAALIARTEFVGLVQGGQLAATQVVADATGEAYRKVWRTAPGAEYPRHELYEGLDGQTVELNATFIVGADLLKYPGDPDGDPGEVCNCRCSLDFLTRDEAAQAEEAAQQIPSEPSFTPSSEPQAIVEPTTAIPNTGQIDLSTGDVLGDGTNVNEVYIVEREGEQFVVKPQGPAPAQMRENIPPGHDIERETSAYSMAKWIDRLNPDLGVQTPELVSGTVTQPAREIYKYDPVKFPVHGYGNVTQPAGTVRAAISRFIPDAVTGVRSELGLRGVDDQAIKNGGLYEAIVGNLDRHANNFMIDEGAAPDKALHLIDNGLTFPTENLGAPDNANIFRARASRIGLELDPAETQLLSDLQIHREEITAELRANGLDAESIDAMWSRIANMLQTGEVSFDSEGGYVERDIGPINRGEPMVGLNLVDEPVLAEDSFFNEGSLHERPATPLGGQNPPGDSLGVPTANVRYLLQDIEAQRLGPEDLVPGAIGRGIFIEAGYTPEEISAARDVLLERQRGGG